MRNTVSLLEYAKLLSMRTIIKITLTISALSLSGCVQFSRLCDAFSNPNVAQWTNTELYSDRTYASPEGNVVKFRLYSAEKSESFYQDGLHASSKKGIICRTNAQYLFDSENTPYSLSLTFYHLERVNRTVDEEILTLDVVTGKGDERSLSQEFALQLNDPQKSVTDQVWQEVARRFAIEHEVNKTIAGNEYSNVLHYYKTGPSVLPPESANSSTDPTEAHRTEAPFVSIRFAESVGLIQFELDNGETYTLLSD